MPAKTKEPIKCYRCSGTGKLNHFSHIADGVCFRCKGSGILGHRSINSKGYSECFVADFFGVNLFPNEPYFPADQSKMTVLEVFCNIGHPTAEYKVMKDNEFYYVGQPICRGSSWYAIPIDRWEEFKKHWNKCRAYKARDGQQNTITA